MKITWSKMIFALSLVFTAGLSLAQTPNPMDVIPDAMPFDVPYGTPISLDKAEALINEVIAESKRRNWKNLFRLRWDLIIILIISTRPRRRFDG